MFKLNYLLWLLFIPTPMEWIGGLRVRPIPYAICIVVYIHVGLTLEVAFAQGSLYAD
jgi:hypothetical protein